jgi:pimeloyl-ACP methyl ester carboxylesterase
MIKKIILSIIVIFSCSSFAINQTSKFAETNGIKTHYLEWGVGKKTIILLHSLTDTAEVWKGFAPLLSKNYRIIAPSRRGVGKTEKSLSGYEIENLAKDVKGLIKSLKLENVNLVGHSFGGNIAVVVAANSPDKISSLVLIEGGFWEKRKSPIIPECPKPIENDCLISNTIKREIGDYDAERFYSKLSMPTLLIMGEPPEFAKANLSEAEKESRKFFDAAVGHMEEVSRDKLKNGESSLVKNAQHWVFVDQRAIVADSLLKFYKDK